MDHFNCRNVIRITQLNTFSSENRRTVKVSKMVKIDDEEGSETNERIDLSIMEAPIIVGECAVLNIGAISPNTVEVIVNGDGYKIPVHNLLRHFQRYPDMLEDLFRILLELNYFRTMEMMAKTINL